MEATGKTMTHDELIERIRLNIVDKCPSINVKGKCEFKCWNCTISAAMLSVLELHKPNSSEYFLKDVCLACTEDIDYYEYYPCRTIIAIDKEIGDGIRQVS
jgi:hypothetical protein